MESVAKPEARWRRVAGSGRAQRGDLAAIAIAVAGIWLFWSQYANQSTLSWWYDNVQFLSATTALPSPDYNLTTLPWQVARPRVFEMGQGTATMVTSDESFAYQAFATINTRGARAADFQFDVEVVAGGVTIGLLQSGRWIAASSSQRPGPFSDSNSALLGYGRSITVVIANDNPAGESRITIKSLRLYLRK